MLDVLARLVDKSLVTVEDPASARYRLLDTIRQFAAERLEGGRRARGVEARHRLWAQALADEHDPATLRGAAGAHFRAWRRTTTTSAPRSRPASATSPPLL